MKNTSAQALKEFNKTDKRENHYKAILRALMFTPACNKEISLRCGLTYHQVARRTSELISKGLIKLKEVKLTNHAKTPVNIYELKN